MLIKLKHFFHKLFKSQVHRALYLNEVSVNFSRLCLKTLPFSVKFNVILNNDDIHDIHGIHKSFVSQRNKKFHFLRCIISKKYFPFQCHFHSTLMFQKKYFKTDTSFSPVLLIHFLSSKRRRKALLFDVITYSRRIATVL